ncbi:hypothetical protein FFI94_001840 [Rhodococcus sp. KBS0724]|uniref:hypothetical protein n=1 Tax=Rhodococcus sp. KBS0724 TaxID=1179674 RepID=UPI00110EFE64|nr:hypothetical protein [Rhodococcus sp. KBS0724]TSD45020.1 hypothetical protein FFI94_001840 [Rhodococcus sp. KBS0724]
MTRQLAWRLWHAYPGHSDELFSPMRSKAVKDMPIARWSKASKHAECAINANPHLQWNRHHEAPFENCACGIGAIPELSDVMTRYALLCSFAEKRTVDRFHFNTRPLVVVGTIRVSGKVIDRLPHNTDVPELRVQYARIRELWLPGVGADIEQLKDALALRFRVPVHLGIPQESA